MRPRCLSSSSTTSHVMDFSATASDAAASYDVITMSGFGTRSGKASRVLCVADLPSRLPGDSHSSWSCITLRAARLPAYTITLASSPTHSAVSPSQNGSIVAGATMRMGRTASISCLRHCRKEMMVAVLPRPTSSAMAQGVPEAHRARSQLSASSWCGSRVAPPRTHSGCSATSGRLTAAASLAASATATWSAWARRRADCWRSHRALCSGRY
mmetsp:Transcript_12911/g.39039  ORF Transcript_12911/g.39039 Transcript_12911/m.39039 type:complete len:213 (-) Transcript_12911:2604-3242(-)